MVITKHKMGVIQLTMLTMVNMIGSGVILLPAQLAAVGNISIFSWLVTAFGSMLLAYAFAKCGRFSKKAGGMGGYAEYAFGKSGNMTANYTYALACVIGDVAIALTAVGYFCTFLNIKIGGLETALFTILFLWLTTLPNFWSSKVTGRIGAITIWGVIIPIIGTFTVGWFWFSPTTYAESWNPHNLTIFQALPQSLALTLWAFLGLESACANSDAVKNPEKAVPIAVLTATLFTAVIYILSTAVIGGIVPAHILADSAAPFGLVYSYMFNGTTGKVIELAMAIACVGSLLTWQFTSGQVCKSAADAGYFFQFFGKVTKRGAPIIGLLVIVIAQSLFTLMTISPSLNKEFNIIVDFTDVINVMPYVLSMAACSAVVKSSADFAAHKISRASLIVTGIVAFLANVYTFYVIYSAGTQAVVWGSLVTFTGWVVFGKFISSKLSHPERYPNCDSGSGNSLGTAAAVVVAPPPESTALTAEANKQ